MQEKPVTLSLTIKFTIEPPKFEKDGFQSKPLSCSEGDLEWVTQIPDVKATEAGPIKVSMDEESEVAKFFNLNKSGFIHLIGSKLSDFHKSDQCVEGDKLTLDFVLENDLLGKSTDSLDIDIDRVT